MKLNLDWSRPILLRDGASENLIYALELERLPSVSGVYVFGRRHGSSLEALYVGKANDLRSRVTGQLNNLRLMQHVKNAKSGKRVLLTGRFISRRGQQKMKCLRILERALIRYFLSEGHDLVNVHGTRLRRHEVASVGKHPKRFIPTLMYLERAGKE